MKYAHLDRLRDDEEELLRATSVTIHVRVWPGGGGYEASVPGYSGLIGFRTLEDLEPLRRTLQRHLDGLTNSAAALFLHETCRIPEKGARVGVLLRAPSIVVLEALKDAL